ncbi:carbohydrate ABC transporter permease [Acrocarpospora catenulata]|uniref:carbohydrate ABC transporter permease n=1 Tax=Acrocarpospora catenulata TaxID=2836182 RepID=UPI001BD99C27|nr:sugar ABC transporter permease [Acrocarpospora catenulata]
MAATTHPAAHPPSRRGLSARAKENIAGWLFVAPVVIILGLFMLLPILMALWVSFTDWNGQGSPFKSTVPMAGLDNYTKLFTDEGLARQDFMTSLRNNFYYVVIVVPAQTVLALGLAIVVNSRVLKGKTFFRGAFFFPSVTSSVAISVVFLFIFANSGAVNGLLGLFGIEGPQWFSDARGTLHLLLSAVGLWDIDNPPAALLSGGPFGLSWWEWLSGPSVGMMTIIILVIWTSSGTFMLMFLAALQDIPASLSEAAMIDGADRKRVFRHVTLPMLKPTLFLVLTLGMIATWMVFDQVYVMSQGNPAKTTLTPAYLSYRTAFRNFEYGPGTAISFVLFAIIVIMTLAQRWIMRDRGAPGRSRAAAAQREV